MPDSFDAVIVGAGASGGWAATRLAEAALRVALLDAGRRHTAVTSGSTRPDSS